MTSEKTKLKDRIVRQAINSVLKNHKVDEVSLLTISKELSDIEKVSIFSYFNQKFHNIWNKKLKIK